MTLLLLAVLGLTPTADAAAPGQQTTALSSQQIATMLMQHEGDRAQIEADLKEARRILAEAKKAAAARGPDPTVPVVDLAPLTGRVAALEAQLGTVNSQIAALNAAVAGKASQADLERLADWVFTNTVRRSELVAIDGRLTALENAPEPEPTVVHDTHTTVVRTSGTRWQLAVNEAVMMAPPMPGSSLSVMDRTEVSGRLQVATDQVWLGAEVDAGYGFAADSTSLRALALMSVNLGETTDLDLGVGPSYLCEGAFTGPDLCSSTRFGGQGQIGISQGIGPVGIGAFIGGGYDSVASVTVGSGGIGYGYAGIRLFAGKVGSGTYVQ